MQRKYVRSLHGILDVSGLEYEDTEIALGETPPSLTGSLERWVGRDPLTRTAMEGELRGESSAQW